MPTFVLVLLAAVVAVVVLVHMLRSGPSAPAFYAARPQNELNAKVCSGEISLAEGQRREAELKWTEG
jgi:hypothetical protein